MFLAAYGACSCDVSDSHTYSFYSYTFSTIMLLIYADECRLLICEAFMTVELPPHIVYHDLLAVLKECGDNSKVVVS